MIKKIIGQQNITKTKQIIKFINDTVYFNFHKRIICRNSNTLYTKFEQSGKHVFFGYYDIQQLDDREEKLLVHVVPSRAVACKDCAEIGYYDVSSRKYFPLAKTIAWCWQQGARLRWYPLNNDRILYNDVEQGEYVTRVFDLVQNRVVSTICTALYDIDATASFGLSINFSRLQRLRPGYGYSTLPDKTHDQSAPEDDGIFYVDLKSNTKKLIVSLADLAASVTDTNADQHYINHISISPDGKRFIFFHIWTLNEDTHWKTRLYIYELSTEKLKLLEKVDRVSHYNWIDSNTLMTTCYDDEKKAYYCTYNVSSGDKTMLNSQCLRKDGHPTALMDRESFISDTYPLGHDMQILFKYSFIEDKKKDILMIYSDARMFEEKRCDLHPRVSRSEKYISIDTTFEHGIRQVLLIQRWR